MSRKKILWLCSWYPSKIEPFNGDFIQRHAKAASLYNDIYVIHVIGDNSRSAQRISTEINIDGNLVEFRVYYKKSNSWWGRLLGHYQLLRQYKNAVRTYIEASGAPGLVHVHVPIKAGIIALWMKKKYNTPYLVTEHWGIYNDVEANNYSTKSGAFKHFTKKIIRNASDFISVSKFLGEGINKLVIEKKYEIVPNVVNTELFNYQPANASSFRFIHVSNMVPLKNAEGILRAFKLLSDKITNVDLIMVGDTDPSIRELASTMNFKEGIVKFRGEVPYQQVAKEMQQANCFVLFSNIENSPCVIGEALCCGLPVIAANVGGVPELLDDTKGMLIEARNEMALVNAMQQMIDNYSRYDRSKIALDAKEKFSYEKVGSQMDLIYTNIMATRGNT